ncbi:hypothetical protein CPS_3717 [Colwellia psychrerythraea 34H]|uniref:Uncharacterized protein n=1 Tax=Colwellia psychrerythraea (strain 34H / ATCC BAA-681) TaxID=167879 RepID=Q47XT6_COLP3|nr:hypothetical protein CPS_3717 [Colwellia psychrerythraea 34H]
MFKNIQIIPITLNVYLSIIKLECTNKNIEVNDE